MISGSATAAGTRRYAARFSRAPGYSGATSNSRPHIGLGTYGGDADEQTDRRYAESVRHALTVGCNVLDTAVAYRHQRSERVIGRSLAALIEHRRVARDEVIVSSKAGFLPFDSDYAGTVLGVRPGDVLSVRPRRSFRGVAPGHCIAPPFLRHQIDMSRRNSGARPSTSSTSTTPTRNC